MDEKFEKKVQWAIGIILVGVLLYPTDLNPFKQKNPSWQVIKEAVASTVYCSNWDYDGNGEITIGYAPCVRLTNVTFDTEQGDEYCYSTDVEIGGYQGQSYDSIDRWNVYGHKYYCVSWTPKYIESDMNNPSDWQVKFGSDSPANLV